MQLWGKRELPFVSAGASHGQQCNLCSSIASDQLSCWVGSDEFLCSHEQLRITNSFAENKSVKKATKILLVLHDVCLAKEKQCFGKLMLLAIYSVFLIFTWLLKNNLILKYLYYCSPVISDYSIKKTLKY